MHPRCAMSSVLLLGLGIAGCASPTTRVAVPDTHPASEHAEEAPVPTDSGTLALPSSPAPQAAPTPTTHEHHQEAGH